MNTRNKGCENSRIFKRKVIRIHQGATRGEIRGLLKKIKTSKAAATNLAARKNKKLS